MFFLKIIKIFIQDFAYCAKSCQNITSDSVDVWKYREACKFSRKGWINSDGTINEDVKKRYNEISGMGESINKCFSNSEKKKAKSRNKTKSMQGKGKTKDKGKGKQRSSKLKASRKMRRRKMKKGGKKAKNRIKKKKKGIATGFLTYNLCMHNID